MVDTCVYLCSMFHYKQTQQLHSLLISCSDEGLLLPITAAVVLSLFVFKPGGCVSYMWPYIDDCVDKVGSSCSVGHTLCAVLAVRSA